MSDLLVAFEEYLLFSKALSHNTISAYIADLHHLTSQANKPLTQLDTESVLSYLSSFENKRTLNRKLSALNAFFNFCHVYQYDHNTIDIAMAKLPQNLPKYLSFEEIMSAISHIDTKGFLGARDYALILFLYASGCRISEALSAHKEDVNQGWLKVRFAKGEKERMVPLAPLAIDALEAYLGYHDIRSSYLWINYKGERLSRVSAFKITKKYLGVSPHVLRHSFASALIIGGADLRVVQELLGHSSLVTTQIYTHIQKQNLADTVHRYHPLGREQ